MRGVGDYYYGDMRRAFMQAGMWGLLRVDSRPSCAGAPVKPLDGLTCKAQPSIIFDPPPLPRPGEPQPQFFLGGGGEISTPSEAPKATVAGAVVRSTTAPRGLRVKRSVALGEFATRGMRMELLTPADSRLVDLRLYRVSGRKLVRALNGRVKIRRGGPIVVRWKAGRRPVSRLRAGTYVLRAKVGPDARHLSRQSDETTVRLTGRVARGTTSTRR
jgi:hypothetical protein